MSANPEAATRQLCSALRTLCDRAEVSGRLPEAAYHVIAIPDAGDHTHTTFLEPAAAADYLRTLVGQDVKVRVFYGRACRITRAPARYLLTHEGRYPLFDDAAGGDEIDDSGSLLGPDAVIVPGPPASAGPSPHATPDEDDDDDDDEDEDGEAGD